MLVDVTAGWRVEIWRVCICRSVNVWSNHTFPSSREGLALEAQGSCTPDYPVPALPVRLFPELMGSYWPLTMEQLQRSHHARVQPGLLCLSGNELELWDISWFLGGLRFRKAHLFVIGLGYLRPPSSHTQPLLVHYRSIPCNVYPAASGWSGSRLVSCTTGSRERGERDGKGSEELMDELASLHCLHFPQQVQITETLLVASPLFFLQTQIRFGHF